MYPKLSKWIEINIPKVRSNHKVYNAFRKYAQLNDVLAQSALTLGSYPEIHYKLMPGSNGIFSGSKFPERVYLAKTLCDRFEKIDSNNKSMHILVESTLLHEMVHWGDWKDGVDQKGEEGKQFEKSAYGKDINRYW